jgi:hypothetical protein
MDLLAVSHVHSSWSYDGKWALKDLATEFAHRGFRILLMTEHDRGFSASRWEEYRSACAKVSSETILVVPGMEYSDSQNRVHVLVWGPVPFLGENLPTRTVLEAVRSANGVAVFAHPARKRAWECFQNDWMEGLRGIEVWNRKYDGWAPGRQSSLLLERCGAIPFVGLDFHTDRQFFPLGMELSINGPVTEAAAIESLQSGRCSPRAFGSELDRALFRGVVPALRMAERSRRAMASVARLSGLR